MFHFKFIVSFFILKEIFGATRQYKNRSTLGQVEFYFIWECASIEQPLS